MTSVPTNRPTTVFNLPERLAAKTDAALIGDDEQHFAAVAQTLEHQIADLTDRVGALRKAPGGIGRAAADRDREIYRLTGQLRLLRRFGLDICLGRMISEDLEPAYVGRVGLVDGTGRRLLIDWRAPAAEPFFAATPAHRMGLISRRRYRWSQGRITDYWDEVLSPEGLRGQVALDEESAFIASLGSSRSPRMRDVLATIQADQDAIIRAPSRGALVVEGGPGTGKTVVALHRAAYLLYADPRVTDRRGGVLFVGPHRPYLAYVSDVLPSLGEEGVQSCTLRNLVVEGATAGVEADAEVARLKSSAAMVTAIEPAVGLYEEPPKRRLTVSTDWGEVVLRGADWAEAFAAADPATPHNEAVDNIWQALVAIIADNLNEDPNEEEVSPGQLGRALRRDAELMFAFRRAWTVVEAADLVADLWTVPAYLRRCAPWLSRDEVAKLQRTDGPAWTASDLPLLDAARQRLGDPGTWRRNRRREAAVAAEHEVMSEVIDHIVEAVHDPGDDVIMLRGQDLQNALVHDDDLPRPDPDLLAGPFAHVIVDEAQELTDSEWQMLIRRCPSRSFTIVGDRAQARHGFTESWQQRLERVGFDRIEHASLTVNYRTPAEIMAAAEPVIRSVFPQANVPTSIRQTGVGVRYGSRSERDAILTDWLGTHAEGTACVIGDPTFRPTGRVQSLTPELAKGLEFDLVVLVDPDRFGTGLEGTVDHYVAMTRATQELAILTESRSTRA